MSAAVTPKANDLVHELPSVASERAPHWPAPGRVPKKRDSFLEHHVTQTLSIFVSDLAKFINLPPTFS